MIEYVLNTGQQEESSLKIKLCQQIQKNGKYILLLFVCLKTSSNVSTISFSWKKTFIH